MSSSLHLNRINILQLNQCDSEKLRYLSPTTRTAPPPPLPPPPSVVPSTEDIDNANCIGRKRNDNNMCSHHHCHHTRGEIPSNSEWSCGIATKGSIYTPPPPLSAAAAAAAASNAKALHDYDGDMKTTTTTTWTTPTTTTTMGGRGSTSINSRTCKGICCTVESVQCAPALMDTHHKVGNGTLTTTNDSNFTCVSTLNDGRVTCAVLPQPCPLECVHRRCCRTERLATAIAPAASSIQEPSQAEADNHIGKHLSQANSRTLPSTTNTNTNTNTTSWASTSSVSSPPSVQDFAKCLTAEEKSSFPPNRTENSLAKGPLSANSCDFVFSELYFSPFRGVFCYNLNTCPAIGAETLQGFLKDSLGHFCHPKRIFLVASQSSHSQWLASLSSLSPSSSKADAARPNWVAPPGHRFNYLILSATNLNSALWFINNELVNNLNENLYFQPTPTPTLTSSLSSSLSSAPIPVPTSQSSSSTKSSGEPAAAAAAARAAGAARAAERSNFFKSSRLPEKKPQGDNKNDKNEKACDEARRRQPTPSPSPHKNDNDTTSPPRCHALDSYTQQKASHSLLKVSDVKKEEFVDDKSSNNDNNDNKRQCNGSCIETPPTTTTVKVSSDKNINNSSHLDDAFKASQRLKRLEENFKDLTVVRKVTASLWRPSLLNEFTTSTNNGIVSENQFPTRSLKQSTIQKNIDKDVKRSSSSLLASCNSDSINLPPSSSSDKEKGKSSLLLLPTIYTTPNNDVIINIESTSPTPVKNNNKSDNNNNCDASFCHFNNNNNTNKFLNESHANRATNCTSFVNNNKNNNRLSCKSALNFSKKKDIFYISRPVPSISEFDVRNLTNCNKINQFSDGTVTFECYDELLDDYDDDADGDEEEANVANIPNECAKKRNNEIGCECQKCRLNNFENSNQDAAAAAPTVVAAANVTVTNNNFIYKYDYPSSAGVRSSSSVEFISTSNSDRLADSFDSEMREINGQLRGLLKKPNRPPPARKNRVVFDETRNEFFEADYIILIREDCAYDEEDEEPCTCGEHELVRLCCEEGCQCNYTNEDTRTPQSPKFAPPIDFVDEAALSPPDGYKDNGLKNSLGGALSGHIFGAQHIQQLQVIQRLQQQRAAMLAARNINPTSQPSVPPSATTPATVAAAAAAGQQPSGPVIAHTAQPLPHTQTPAGVAATHPQPQSSPQPQLQSHSPDDDSQPVCTECAECVECAAKQLQDSECTSPQCQEEVAQLSVPTVALVPLHSSSPERRITQKEIIAGEERPKYVLQAQYKPVSVTERRIVREATEDITTTSTAPVILQTATVTAPSITSGGIIATPPPAVASVAGVAATGIATAAAAAAPPSSSAINSVSESTTDLIPEPKPPIPPKESSPTQISGILKGGKLWKQESISQSDDMNTSSEDDANAKRSVRFVTEDTLATSRDGDGQAAPDSPEHDSQINELIPIKKHSTLFTNSLRPNSAVRQLFPSSVHQTSSVLTHEALRAFDESKRAGNLLPNMVGGNPGDSDTVRRSIERNILRRSLIKKKAVKSDISLEERIKQLTCDIDESNEDPGQDSNDENGKANLYNGEPSAHRDSPTGEENPHQKYSNDKSFSPSSSVSSSSSGSSSAYKKISDIFNRDKKQEKIMEMEENPIVIIPQECRCPAAPDLGMGIQVPVVHTQIHRTPPRQTEPKRQFLSTLAPLTACVAGQKDDLSSYYTLAAGEGHSTTNTHFAQYNMSDMEPILCNDEMRKVAPDVIAGTPGQEQDELAAFAQQEANRTEKIKKRYTNETSNASSDDDEQNDYGFNKRPSVRGIKPKFSSTNEILQQMQDQLNKSMPSLQSNTSIKSYTLPKQASSSSINKQIQNVQPQMPQQQQQQPQQQQQQQQQQQIPASTAISQQQTERTWSFYGDPEQQRIPIDGNMHPGYYHTMPTVFQQTFQGQEETLMYQNCVTMEQYGRYARSPTRRPESPPPLRNYHQTMVLIPCNAETYSQFAATGIDPKVAQIQRQNILEYQQVTQQTIRVPISYALPAMQLHVVAGRGHSTQQYVQHQQHLPAQQQPQQRVLGPRYSMPQDGTMGFSERGVPEGAAAVSHTDCKGIVSPTSQANQPQQQQQQQQQMPNCNQSTVTSTGPPGSVYYAMNV